MTHDAAQGWHDDLLVGGIGPSTITLFRVGQHYCAYGNAAPIVATATGWPLTRYAGGDGTQRRVCRISAGALEDAVVALKARGYRVLTGTVGA